MDSSPRTKPPLLGSNRVRLVVLWLLQAALLALDLVSGPDLSLLGFFFIPALLAATFSSPRQVLLLALSALACGLIFGGRNDVLTSTDFLVRLASLVIIALLTVTLAVSRTRTVDALADERDLVRGTLDSLLDPHVLLRAVRNDQGAITDFVFADANEAACRHNHLPREKLLGRCLLELLPAHTSTGLLDMYRQALESDQPLVLNDFVYPHEILAEERRYDIRAIRIGDALSFTWRDVTDRYLTARQLAASEEHYRLLTENSYDTAIRVDDNDTVLWISPSIKALLGWTPEEWVGRKVTEFVAPESLPSLQANLRRVARGKPIVARYQALAKNGRAHWAESRAMPYFDAQGRRRGITAAFHLIDEQVAMEQQLERRARTDELTNLLNRKEVFERLEALGGKHPRTGHSIAVLFCDIDKFKTINDTHGHAAGDEVLRVMADRIRGCLRSTDDLGARVGGDELLVVLHGVQDLDNAVAVAEKLRLSAAQPVPIPGGTVQVTVSIGVTLARPGEESGTLVARADEAMYRAKQSGRNQVIPMLLPEK